LAGLGACEADGSTALLDRLTACGKAFVGSAGGVGRHHLDTPVAHVKFVGGDLGQRARNALSEFDLAGKHRYGAIGVDAQPRRQQAIAVKAAGEMCGAFGALPQRPYRRIGDPDHKAGTGLQEIAAGHTPGRRRHDSSPLDARKTARTMRLCAPQRHRWPSSARFTSASLGFGLRASSACAAMIIPLLQ